MFVVWVYYLKNNLYGRCVGLFLIESWKYGYLLLICIFYKCGNIDEVESRVVLENVIYFLKYLLGGYECEINFCI